MAISDSYFVVIHIYIRNNCRCDGKIFIMLRIKKNGVFQYMVVKWRNNQYFFHYFF
jgi:hypothetical protein